MSLGERIRMRRQQKGLTKVELAKQVGVSHIQIGRYEANSSKPSTSIIQKISHVLETSNDYLIIGAEPRHANFNDQKLEEALNRVKGLPDADRWLAYDILENIITRSQFEEKFTSMSKNISGRKESSY